MTNQDDRRQQLIQGLQEDLAREYKAIIQYIVYSQAISEPQYMNIAAELEKHAHEELDHALRIAKQIDYYGEYPNITPMAAQPSEDSKTMLEYDLQGEDETVANYRQRIQQALALGEYALAEELQEIIRQEQEHQIDLATALGVIADPSRRGGTTRP
ncbi:MAG: ferritin-like domain-containing protein [Roseiflexaceae bacterium]